MTPSAPAEMTHTPDSPAASTLPSAGFRRMDQPFWLKALVTGGGVGLIGLELWWFLFSRPRPSTSRPPASPTPGGPPTSDPVATND
jgi:plastocyanin domain-containing protein